MIGKRHSNSWRSWIAWFSFSVFLGLGLSSCTSVKEYQKQFVNDPEMRLTPLDSERVESNGHLYREGASGESNGITGGGCGCY